MIYGSIQAIRGVAALLVLTMHVILTVSTFYGQYGADAGLLSVAAPYLRPLGIIGVDLFFVVSGFVLYLAARRVSEQIEIIDTYRFALNRLLRIYPLYWIVFLSTAASTDILTPGTLATSFANWPEVFLVDTSNIYEVVGPAWTLMYELYFYMGISFILLVAPRRLHAMLALWVVIHVFLIAMARHGIIAQTAPITDPILLDFAAGLFLGYLSLRHDRSYEKVVLGGAIACLAAGLLFLDLRSGQVDRLWRLLTFGSFAIGVIYVVVSLERKSARPVRSFQSVGNASYSIYLWHMPVFWTLNWVGVSLGFYTFTHPYLTALSWSGAALALAFLSFHLIEAPILKLIRSRRKLIHEHRENGSEFHHIK